MKLSGLPCVPFCFVRCWCCFRSSCFFLLYGMKRRQSRAFRRACPPSALAVRRLPAALRVGNSLIIQKNRMTRKTAILLFVACFLLFPHQVAPFNCGKQTESRRTSSLRKNSTFATPKAQTAQFHVSRETFT